jgi:hypothetical protein
MTMQRGLLPHVVLAALGIGSSGTACAEWTKTYVIEWYESAMYFGGKDILAPGTDCPQGTNPEIDWVKVLIKAGYSPDEAKWLRSPETRVAARCMGKIKWRSVGAIARTSISILRRIPIRD